MTNEDKKDFNAVLHDNKDIPKFQTITDEKSIEKYGGSKIVLCSANRLWQSNYCWENTRILCGIE